MNKKICLHVKKFLFYESIKKQIKCLIGNLKKNNNNIIKKYISIIKWLQVEKIMSALEAIEPVHKFSRCKPQNSKPGGPKDVKEPLLK